MSNGENNSRLTAMAYPTGYAVAYNYNSGLDDRISRLSSLSDSTSVLEAYQGKNWCQFIFSLAHVLSKG